jgi:hypothetical protein
MSGCSAATVCCVATPPWLRATTEFLMASRWIPGAAHIDSEGLKHFLERGFAAVNYLFDTYGFPESENEVLSMGVTQILENSMIDPDRDGYSLG